MSLECIDVSFSYGDTPVLKNITFRAHPPKLIALIGPNAAGKSTLLHCVAGLLTHDGTIRLDGEELRGLSHRKRWEQISYLPQSPPHRMALTVFECVLLGRVNQLSWTVNDEEVHQVRETLDRLDLTHLAERQYGELSGGQQQLVGIAQALAKSSKLLLMDEPTSGLDLNHRLEILKTVQLLIQEQKMLGVLALHDLNLAARFSDEMIVLHQGERYADGPPREVLNSQTLREVYDVQADVVRSEEGVPQVHLKQSL